MTMITNAITVESIKTVAATLAQNTGRAHRRLRDAELPVTREEADSFMKANLDALKNLWSQVRTASDVVDDYDRALATARDAYQAGTTNLGEIVQQRAGIDVSDYAALQVGKRLAVEEDALRAALDALAREIDAASDPHRLVVAYVGKAIETALYLDRDIKRRRLRDVLSEMRSRLGIIRHSGDEHAALQETWERRLQRRFALPEVRE
jgi:hypothetical protein